MKMMLLPRTAALCVLLTLPLPGFAQEGDTLADIRQELTQLFVQVQRLTRELSTTGGLNSGIAGNTPLERLDAIEAELQRLTSKAEQMEFRVNTITSDANNRIGDLNFRLCELEPDCDIANLDETPLGGLDVAVATPVSTAPDGGTSVVIGEQADIDLARAALSAGDYDAAIAQLASFVTDYPGSPLTPEANYLRGEALQGQGRITDAARAYLDAFSGDPTGQRGPSALFKLGAALGQIGQTQDACLTLAEVNVRFPGDPAVQDAQTEMQSLGCQ